MTDNSNRRLIPLTKWGESHQWPPLGGLRHLVFNSKENGFDAVVVRVGRRILLDETAFFAWVDSQRANGQEADLARSQ